MIYVQQRRLVEYEADYRAMTLEQQLNTVAIASRLGQWAFLQVIHNDGLNYFQRESCASLVDNTARQNAAPSAEHYAGMCASLREVLNHA